jgi:formamidase
LPTHEVRVDYSKTLSQQPETGHNRWHPDIPPVVRCDPGEEVVLETRDAFDGQMGPAATLETVAAPNLNVVHPLTGPVHVNGAEAGDLLEIEILEVEPDRYGYTVQVPGFGFLRDQFPDPFMVRWAIAGGWATSEDLPGVRVPGAPFMGTIVNAGVWMVASAHEHRLGHLHEAQRVPNGQRRPAVGAGRP